jgi:hypothetical protein
MALLVTRESFELKLLFHIIFLNNHDLCFLFPNVRQMRSRTKRSRLLSTSTREEISNSKFFFQIHHRLEFPAESYQLQSISVPPGMGFGLGLINISDTQHEILCKLYCTSNFFTRREEATSSNQRNSPSTLHTARWFRPTCYVLVYRLRLTK